MSNKTYDFKKELAWSMSVEELRVFDDYYWASLPGLKGIKFHEEMEKQRQGIDKTLLFNDGTIITIDEKMDRYKTKNFFIELYTDIYKGSKGWLYKNKCDYVVYGFTYGACYWLPMKALRDAFDAAQKPTGHEWVREFEPKWIKNHGYLGMGLAMPKIITLEYIKPYIDKKWASAHKFDMIKKATGEERLGDKWRD